MNKLIAQIQKLCALGTPQVTLSRSQVTRLLEYAEKTAAKSRDIETKRLRLAMHRAETALGAAVRQLEAVTCALETERERGHASK